MEKGGVKGDSCPPPHCFSPIPPPEHVHHLTAVTEVRGQVRWRLQGRVCAPQVNGLAEEEEEPWRQVGSCWVARAVWEEHSEDEEVRRAGNEEAASSLDEEEPTLSGK